MVPPDLTALALAVEVEGALLPLLQAASNIAAAPTRAAATAHRLLGPIDAPIVRPHRGKPPFVGRRHGTVTQNSGNGNEFRRP